MKLSPLHHKGNPLKIALLAGDGIGPTVMDAALPALDVLGIPHQKFTGKIGWECWRSGGDPVPDSTWDLIRSTDTVLLGAITSKPLNDALKELNPELRDRNLRYTSPVIQLRQKLGLFANVRPVKDYLSGRTKFDFAVIRENTEGLYAGFDFAEIPEQIWNLVRHGSLNFSDPRDATVALRIQSRQGLTRLFHFAFDYARKNGLNKVTWADKPNVLRYSGNFARELLEEVACSHPGIEWEIQNADAVAMWMVRKPESMGVVVGENMFGDLLSDLGAGIMGGLGLAPSANIGLAGSYFEPVHGSAPKYAGTDIPNPTAMFLTIALMLRHHGFTEESARLEKAVSETIQEGRFLTRDIGGKSGTLGMAGRILDFCQNGKRGAKAAFIATGEELLDGSFTNTATAHFARETAKLGFHPHSHAVTGDSLSEIRKVLASTLDSSDLVIVSGGLGPTSDDNTREAVAEELNAPLQFNESEWERIGRRLERLGLPASEPNRKQALFPEGSEVVVNENGTASGFILRDGAKTVVALPGPPAESFPLLERILKSGRLSGPDLQDTTNHFWRLLGVTESEIAADLEETLRQAQVSPAIRYCWKYPYVDITLISRKEEDSQLPLEKIEALFRPHLVGKDAASATSLLREALASTGTRLFLQDQATGGQIYRDLAQPSTLELLHAFPPGKEIEGPALAVEVRGLREYWSGSANGQAQFTAEVRGIGLPGRPWPVRLQKSLPLRGDSIRQGASEHVAFFLMNILKGEK